MGGGLGGVLGCAVGHVEMPQRYKKKASLHSELDLGSTDGLHKGDFAGFYLQLERQEAGRTSSWCADGMTSLVSAQKTAPFCHQPLYDGDREGMAAPAPSRYPNLGLVLLIRSRGPMPRASAPRKNGDPCSNQD